MELSLELHSASPVVVCRVFQPWVLFFAIPLSWRGLLDEFQPFGFWSPKSLVISLLLSCSFTIFGGGIILLAFHLPAWFFSLFPFYKIRTQSGGITPHSVPYAPLF